MSVIDPRGKKPPYVQIADQLRQRIAAGTYPPGGAIPSWADLASEFGVSPDTAARAVKVLRDEGLVEAVGTRGHYVKEAA